VTAVADVPALALTGTGVYDIPEDVYHSDPVLGGSLTSSGARKILPPGCPALFRYEQLHGRPEKRAFDIGHAAHKLVLGVGAPLVVIEADDWRTKAAKEQRDAAYAAGQVPLLTADHEQVVAMAEALRQHPVASALFDPDHGKPEQSLFWEDATHGVTRRARLDWLPDASGGRLIVPDYKTCVSAEPRSLAKSVANYGYHQQAEWYLAAVRALGLADEDAAFVFVAQEKTPPYLVTVFELDVDALRIGRERNRLALEVYAECRASDTWPSYTSDVELISLPAWATYQHQELAS
jgi:hypothetical protein